MLLAIDPGNKQSGYVIFDGERVHESGVLSNDALLNARLLGVGRMVIEGIASYGMPVGAEVFDTCIWIGRMGQAFGWDAVQLIYRKDVKLHLCGTTRAKDANVRQAIIDLFGGKDKAIGKKADPGPLYGVKSHAWSALAVAIVACNAGFMDAEPVGEAYPGSDS